MEPSGRAAIVVVPRSPARLPNRGTDGTTQGDRTEVRRLIHLHGRPAVISAQRTSAGAFALAARAADQPTADAALGRLRFWTGVDDDLAAFLERFAEDPLIGRSVREAPHARPFRRPLPWEVLQAAVCEQLVDDERSQAIKRALIHRHGPRHDGLLDAPDAATTAALAPAELEACGLAAQRAGTLRRAAREVASGRVDLLDPALRDAGWRRLRALPGIGPWTLSILALHGQGVPDALPAGDHAYRVIVGRELHGPRGPKATELEVVAFFERFRPYRGLAGWHVLRTAAAQPASRGR